MGRVLPLIQYISKQISAYAEHYERFVNYWDVISLKKVFTHGNDVGM